MRYIAALFLLCISGLAFGHTKDNQNPPCYNCWVMNTGQHYSYTKAASVTVKLGDNHYGVIVAGGYRPGSAEAAQCNYVGGSKSELFDYQSNRWIELPESNPTYDNRMAYIPNKNVVLLIGRLCGGKHLFYSQILKLDNILDSPTIKRWIPTGRNKLSTTPGYGNLSQTGITTFEPDTTITTGFDPQSQTFMEPADKAVIFNTSQVSTVGLNNNYYYQYQAPDFMYYDVDSDVWSLGEVTPQDKNIGIYTCNPPLIMQLHDQLPTGNGYQNTSNLLIFDGYDAPEYQCRMGSNQSTYYSYNNIYPYLTNIVESANYYVYYKPYIATYNISQSDSLRGFLIVDNIGTNFAQWEIYTPYAQRALTDTNKGPIGRLHGSLSALGMGDHFTPLFSLTRYFVFTGGVDSNSLKPSLTCDIFDLSKMDWSLNSCGKLNQERTDSTLAELRNINAGAIIIGGTSPESAKTSEIYYWKQN